MIKKSNSPYPEILFHCTSSKALRGILNKRAFFPSYTNEKIFIDNLNFRDFYVPMVSFCDLRLSELPFHMKKYGEFGIGLKKSWAFNKGLNPVAYVNEKSDFTISLLDGLTDFFNHINTINDWETSIKANKTYMKVLNTERYIKNYEGDLIRKKINRGKYRFADEREWRFVPNLSNNNIWPFLPSITTDMNPHNKLLQNYPLIFNTDDIKYIIVPKDKNIHSLRKIIDKLHSYTQPEKDHLISKILTAEQIRNDI